MQAAFFSLCLKPSDGFGHSSRANATGADLHGAHTAIVNGPDLLQVGAPDGFGFVMCMADVVARHRFFTTNFASSGHFRNLLKV